MNHAMEFSESKCEVFQADEKTKLLSHVWVPEEEPKAVFLAIHGGMAHAGDWVTPAKYFTGKGVAVYAPDLRWHGTYPQYNDDVNMFHIDSYDTYARDIDRYYAEIRKNHPDTPVFIIGHSNGALIALYYGLTIGKDRDCAGYILSSPWIKNKVSVSLPLVLISKLIKLFNPRFAVEPAPLTDILTHDKEITARHHADEASGLRSSKVTVGLAAASEKAQAFVTKHMKEWGNTPVIAFIAGKDELADPEVSNQVLNSITAAPVTLYNYPENFHENFNELNRDEIFAKIDEWMQDKI